MEITKIEEKFDLDEQFDLEPQGCLNDCYTYAGKYSGDVIQENAWIAGGGSKTSWIAATGFWCSLTINAKLTTWW